MFTQAPTGDSFPMWWFFLVVTLPPCWSIGRRWLHRRRRGDEPDPDGARMLRRYTPTVAVGDGVTSGSFTLAPAERALVGVSAVGTGVVLRASGLQWGSSGLSTAGWSAATVVSVGLDAPVAATLGFALLSAASVVSLVLLRRQFVRLSPDRLEVRRRVGASRSFDWRNAELAVEVRENDGAWLRGVERATTAVGVVRTITPRGHWIDLPGVRSPMWGANKLDDPLTNTDVKMRLLLRYRQHFATSEPITPT